jgi:hypothetical protein
MHVTKMWWTLETPQAKLVPPDKDGIDMNATLATADMHTPTYAGIASQRPQCLQLLQYKVGYLSKT